MAKKGHTQEQVVNKLREAKVAIAEGSTVAEAARRIGVTEQPLYRWRSEYGSLRIDQVRPHSSLGYRPPTPEALLPANPLPVFVGLT